MLPVLRSIHPQVVIKGFRFLQLTVCKRLSTDIRRDHFQIIHIADIPTILACMGVIKLHVQALQSKAVFVVFQELTDQTRHQSMVRIRVIVCLFIQQIVSVDRLIQVIHMELQSMA